MSKPRMLLHICCAPDATVVIERVSPEYEITGYFYNPNIHPKREYYLRLEEMKRLAQGMGIELVCEEYDLDRWFALTRDLKDEPEGGRRCEVCFRMRLERAADYAKMNGFDMFTTVLTVSPHKKAEVINRIGEEIAREYEIPFLSANFKKKDGFKRSVELSKEFDLYRQDYCGCVYSKEEREKRKRRRIGLLR